ncbi:MAG TPA: GWxTD domain-containing protein [Saprospiraceae bacterium]|nr:GWxTD domain-containing protein [Saprospiraceae bacterium]
MCNRLLFLFIVLIPAYLKAVPDVSLDIQRFISGNTSFAEVTLYIVGSSLNCPAGSNDYGVEYTILIQDQNAKIITGNHFRLITSGCPAKDLIDVKRFVLEPGIYIIDIEMTDIHDSLNTVEISQQTEIEARDSTIYLSDIQLLSVIRNESDGTSALHKSGLYLEPLPFRYYYPALDRLSVYVETYDTDKLPGQPYIQYTIKPAKGEIPEPITAFRKVNRQPVSANVFQLDIQSLISGPYLFETTLFDGNKKQISSRQISFSRYNPIGDSLYIASGSLNLDASFIKSIPEDSLDYYLKAMAPIVNSINVDIMNVLLKKGSAKTKQFFIHRYWTEASGKYADQAFAAYMKVAKVVDDNYRSGFGYGFETDRGHIFLKYGRPDNIIDVEDEPSAPPYEIWFYNNFPATHQNNVRFLFYNPSLAKNDYKLLHSTAIGEIKNERWEVELYKDATLETPGVNEKVMGDNVHRNARNYFENY